MAWSCRSPDLLWYMQQEEAVEEIHTPALLEELEAVPLLTGFGLQQGGPDRSVPTLQAVLLHFLDRVGVVLASRVEAMEYLEQGEAGL